jgi:nitroreductase
MLEAIMNRRSVRAYTNAPVPDEMVQDILESGRWAPSGSNIQPWLFCVVKDGTRLKNIAAFSPGMMSVPPLAIIICTDKELAFERAGAFGRDELSVMDASMAAENMMIAATALGLGICVLKSFNADGIARILKTPEHIRPEFILTVGFPEKNPPAPKKKALADIVFKSETITRVPISPNPFALAATEGMPKSLPRQPEKPRTTAQTPKPIKETVTTMGISK